MTQENINEIIYREINRTVEEKPVCAGCMPDIAKICSDIAEIKYFLHHVLYIETKPSHEDLSRWADDGGPVIEEH